MTVANQTMTDEQRKSLIVDYLKAFDRAGKLRDGGSILDLFAEDAQVYFPKWGLATGKEEIGKMFGDIGSTLKSIKHHYSHFNYIFSRAATSWSARAPAKASTRTDRGARACPNTAPAAGATCSRFAKGRSSAASSISIRTMPGRTRHAIRGSKTNKRRMPAGTSRTGQAAVAFRK